MFASTQNASSTDTSTTSTDDSSGTYFDARSEIHEIYWVAVDANRRNGPQILQHPELHTKKTDEGVSGVVDDYRFFQEQKQDLIEEITGDLDMYGLRKYREDFTEPDEELWTEAASEFYGIPIVGVHQIPADEAQERFGVDYDHDGVDPIYVPILDIEGEEVVYDPDDYYAGEGPDTDADTEESESESEASEDEAKSANTSNTSEDDSESEASDDMANSPQTPDFPAKPSVVQEWLEGRDEDSLNLQEKSTLAKLRDPTKSNRDIAAEIDCSKNTVRKGLMKFLGKDGYEAVKARGKDLRDDDTEAGGVDEYVEKMSGGGSDSDAETVEVPREEFEALQERVERLEAMFNLDAIDNN